jgi:hypothetical protein
MGLAGPGPAPTSPTLLRSDVGGLSSGVAVGVPRAPKDTAMSMSDGGEDATAELAPDARPAPTVWVTCPPCAGAGWVGGRACSLCAGSGKLRADVAMDPDDAEAMEVDAKGDE